MVGAGRRCVVRESSHGRRGTLLAAEKLRTSRWRRRIVGTTGKGSAAGADRWRQLGIRLLTTWGRRAAPTGTEGESTRALPHGRLAEPECAATVLWHESARCDRVSARLIFPAAVADGSSVVEQSNHGCCRLLSRMVCTGCVASMPHCISANTNRRGISCCPRSTRDMCRSRTWS